MIVLVFEIAKGLGKKKVADRAGSFGLTPPDVGVFLYDRLMSILTYNWLLCFGNDIERSYSGNQTAGFDFFFITTSRLLFCISCHVDIVNPTQMCLFRGGMYVTY